MSWAARLGVDSIAAAYASPYGRGATADNSVSEVVQRLRQLPPLVTSFEIEHLRGLLSEAERGERFLLWGGDCAETLEDCTSEVIAGKLKVMLQMSLVLRYAGKRPVIRVGRMAGQYAKPRSSLTETRLDVRTGASVTLPSYFGDLVNEAGFDAASRTPRAERMLTGYTHAAMTINFVRSLVHAGFADVHHPEYWELGLFKRAGLSPEVRAEYQRLVRRVKDALAKAEGVALTESMDDRATSATLAGGACTGLDAPSGPRPFVDRQQSGLDEAGATEFYTSHEALNLHYESAQTRRVPRRDGTYNLCTHLPWLGNRTRGVEGPHVEYLRGIRNPIGVKIGPGTDVDELLDVLRVLSVDDATQRGASGEIAGSGKLVLMPRLGVERVREELARLIDAVRGAGLTALWVCDPMHGNGITTASGRKTRSFDDIASELEASFEIHEREGSRLGGVHVELTGRDVTECIGGAAGLSVEDLERNYETACDPRLNSEQSLELAFRIAEWLAREP